jgi:hypothetical protein
MSQQARAETLAALAGLTHDIFVGDVEDVVRRQSAAASMFQDAGPGEFYFSGDWMNFAVDLETKQSAMATSGWLPDYVGLDAVQGRTAPVRRYDRIALDNFVEKRATGEGAFEDLGRRIFRHQFNSWKNMEIRHAIGYSTGVIALVSSRTSNAIVVLKDGYGHTGTHPLLHIGRGTRLGWYDVSLTVVGGSGVVDSINYDTNAVTFTASWEQGGQETVANDIVYFSTTRTTTADHFELERNLAPNGLGTIIDPGAASTTVFNINNNTYRRWKPFRKASVTFDHLELTEHWLQHGAKRGFDVSPATDKAIAYPSVLAQLARGLMAFQQQAYTGGQLQGGYSIGGGSGNSEGDGIHAGLVVSGIPIYSDGFLYHNVFFTLCYEKLYRVVLGGEADWWSEDGSMWARIADFDGKEAFYGHYMNYFTTDRGAHAALTGITTDFTDADWAADVPSY